MKTSSLYFQNLIISLLTLSDLQLDFHRNSFLIKKAIEKQNTREVCCSCKDKIVI